MHDTTRHVVDRDTRHFVQIYHDLIESDVFRALSPAAFKVYTVLKYRAMGRDNCIPSKKRIATDAGMAERSVTIAINELVICGLIIKHERKRSNGSYSSNEYTIAKTQGTLQNSYPGVVSQMVPLEQDNTEQDTSTLVDVPDLPDEHEQNDGNISEPLRDFGGVPAMKPIDVHGWWWSMAGGEPPARPAGRDMSAAKALLALGFETPEALRDLHDWLWKDMFWRDRGVTLSIMASQATAWIAVHRRNPASDPTSMETYLGSNAYRLERLKRKEFITQLEHLRYNNIPNGERWLADDIALLEHSIERQEGSPA